MLSCFQALLEKVDALHVEVSATQHLSLQLGAYCSQQCEHEPSTPVEEAESKLFAIRTRLHECVRQCRQITCEYEAFRQAMKDLVFWLNENDNALTLLQPVLLDSESVDCVLSEHKASLFSEIGLKCI